MITKTITLTSTDWLVIKSSQTKDDNGFIFWANADLEFAMIKNPGATDTIPLESGRMFGFAKPTTFFVKWQIGDKIYIWPFDWVLSLGSGSGASIIYNGLSPTTETVWGLPAWTDITWRNHDQLFEEMLVESSNPSVQLRWTPTFQLYEVGDTITNPLIEGNGALWQWPTGVLTQLELFRGATSIFTQPSPVPWTRYGTNDTHIINIIAGTSETYSAVVDDDQARSGNVSKIYEGTYPFFWTTALIWTLTQQALRPLTSSYFSVNSVAETGWGKYKADFENAYITITGIQFYNTVSSAWERMGGSKANSLLLRNTTATTHTVQWNVVNYTRYTHNWPDGWALQLRFFTT